MPSTKLKATKNKLDDLLGRSLQLDQSIMLLSELSENEQCLELHAVLKEIERESEENARTIKEARRLVFAS